MAHYPKNFHGDLFTQPFGNASEGLVEHVKLPPVQCAHCSRTWSFSSNRPVTVSQEKLLPMKSLIGLETLPLKEADALTQAWATNFGMKESLLPLKPIAPDAFIKLAQNLAERFGLRGDTLAPGAYFCPGLWHVEHIPSDDFCYPLGSGAVVAQKTKDVFESIHAQGLFFDPLISKSLSDDNRYYELRFQCRIGYKEQRSDCRSCEHFPARFSRMTIGDFPFSPDVMGITGMYYCTRRVRKAIDSNKLTNVSLSKLTDTDYPIPYDADRYEQSVLEIY